MVNSWEFYYPIFLSAFLSLGIPIGLMIISFLVSDKQKEAHQCDPSILRHSPSLENKLVQQSVLGQRMNIQFSLAVNASLILMTLALELIPCAAVLHSESSSGVLQCFFAIVTLAGFAVFGLLYAVRKGDMSWFASYHPEQTDRTEKKQ